MHTFELVILTNFDNEETRIVDFYKNNQFFANDIFLTYIKKHPNIYTIDNFFFFVRVWIENWIFLNPRDGKYIFGMKYISIAPTLDGQARHHRHIQFAALGHIFVHALVSLGPRSN